jgi:hypothetical protein
VSKERPNATSAVGGGHEQSIDRSPPPVPPGDHRPDESAVVFRDDQRVSIMDDQLSEARHSVGVGGFSVAYCPELEDGFHI